VGYRALPELQIRCVKELSVFENWIPLKPVLGGVNSVAHFITVTEKAE